MQFPDLIKPYVFSFDSPDYKGNQPPRQGPPGLVADATQMALMASPAQSLASSSSSSQNPNPPPPANAAVAASDVENFQKFQAAHAAIKKAYGLKAMRPGLTSDSLLLDSGATWHITGKEMQPQQHLRSLLLSQRCRAMLRSRRAAPLPTLS